MTVATAAPLYDALDAFRIDREEYPGVSVPVESRQVNVLAYVSTGASVTQAARDSGVTIGSVKKWRSRDVGGFRGRLAMARAIFAEGLEAIALERVRTQTPDANPRLLIKMLEAHMPEKYGRVGLQEGRAAICFLDALQGRV